MISWPRLRNNNHKEKDNNHRDSLFDLPLYPPYPEENSSDSAISDASKKLTADTNQRIASFSVGKAKQQLTETSEEEWQSRGEKRALALFHAAAEHVPAYKDFLKKRKVNANTIKSFSDFKQLPLIDKENYLRKYSLDQLTWYGKLDSSQVISFSSGSSGEPFFWPRGQILDAETALEHELFLTSSFEMDKKPRCL